MSQAETLYRTPSMTNGVDSTPRNVLSGAYHANPSRCTLVSFICFSGLKRCSLQVRPGDIHWPGSRSAFSSRCWSTTAVPASAPCAASTESALTIAWIDRKIRLRTALSFLLQQDAQYTISRARQRLPLWHVILIRLETQCS